MGNEIWIVTYGDGYTFSGLFIAAFWTELEAKEYCNELEAKNNPAGRYNAGGWDYHHITIGEKPSE